MDKYLNKIIEGDCYDYFSELPKDLVLITDPPYGIDYQANYKKWDGRDSDYKKIIGDNVKFNPTQLLEYQTAVLFGANYYSDLLPVSSWIVWDKRLDEKKDKMFGSSYEMAWYKSPSVSGQKIYRVLHGGVINADSFLGNNEKRYHPTQKPLTLMKRLIQDFSQEEDIIFDPFAGSGSTLVAAKQLGRRFIGIELDSQYIKIANNRLAQEVLF